MIEINYERGGLAFVGCIILGSGLGMLFDNAGAGGAIGVGTGFLVMALLGGKRRGDS